METLQTIETVTTIIVNLIALAMFIKEMRK